MAYKHIVFLAILFIINVNASDTNELCSCDETDPKNNKLLWELLNKLSVEVPEADKDLYTILPGELSPLVDCGCSEINRKKRKAVEQPEMPPVSVENIRETKSRQFPNSDCPIGFVKVGIRCVGEDYELDGEI